MSETAQPTSTQLLFSSAQAMGLQPQRLTKKLFTVTTPKGLRPILSSTSSLNSHLSSCLAKDKFLARTILARHGLPNIPFTEVNSLAEAKAFLSAHGSIIAKPQRGNGAFDINLITAPKQLGGLKLTKYIFEKYIAGRELRYQVLNGRVIAVYESQYGKSVAVDRYMETIAYPAAQWDEQLTEMALQIAEIMDLRFCAVDFLIAPRGKAYVLEINTRPDLKWFHSPTRGPAVNVAQLFLEALLAEDSKLAKPLVAAG